MFRFRRYRVYVIFAIIAIGALYHFTSIDGLEGAGAASVERLKQFGPKFDSKAAESQKDTSKDSAAKDDGEPPIAVPSRVDSGDESAPSPKSVNTDSAGPTSLDDKLNALATSKAEAKDASTTKGAIALLETPPAKETGPVLGGAEATAAGGNPKGRPKVDPTPTHNGTSTASEPADPIINPHGGEGRLEVIGATDKPKIHWTQLPDHFPIPTDLLIQLPTGTPKKIPKVQFDFKKETMDDKTARSKKLDTIRKAFSFSWSGYRKKAWMQDELSPMSGKYRNPFNGWGATLVDSLDTLWMMDLKEEFEEAVEAVKDIDFTTSPRNDIPLFETVIRYLGGLIGAYDVSGMKHKILLDKAVELADILMGAFDTPNRMPMTYYLWKPTFASQPHRAKTRVVLAELGSLSLEFTRLAQITKEARYYDAIARITNELQLWQPDTKVPGLWPQHVDASGCKKPDVPSMSKFESQALQREKPLLADQEAAAAAAANPSLADVGSAKPKDSDHKAGISSDKTSANADTPTSKSAANSEASSRAGEHAHAQGASMAKDPSDDARVKNKNAVNKRDTSSDGSVTPNTYTEPPAKKPDCEPQGLTSPPQAVLEQFTMGGQADSTYEYLPKEYLLLGGLEDQYRKMFEMAAAATKENLLFRPMIPDEKRNILGSGLLNSRGSHDKPEDKHNLTPEGSHLTCFVGGYFALGSKIFDIPEYLDLGKRLADGCVWAYEQTTTGIMPEGFETIACKSMDSCPWNQTLWEDKMDPYGASREQNRLSALKEQQEKKAQREKTRQAFNEKETSSSSQSKKDVSDVKDPKSASDETVKSGLEKDSIIDSGKNPKSVSQSSLHDSSATSDGKASGVESLKKRQLGEVDDGTAAQKPSKSVNDDSPSNQKSSEKSESSQSTAAKQEATEIPSKPASDSLKKANEEALSDATKSNAASPTEDEEEATAKPAPPPPAVSQADAIADEYEPPQLPTREEYVAQRIKDERLPIGMVRIWDKKYILRPEAIESVFILYRATGDNYWREKGWKMFEAIEKHTIATFGATAIRDVTAEKPNPADEMESFWLAETLKYFYLLFSEPDHVSLDDYVLNTEAHPFKMPKP